MVDHFVRNRMNADQKDEQHHQHGEDGSEPPPVRMALE
jgi:hypothetical protein